VLLYAVDIKTAGTLSLVVSLLTMPVALARNSRDNSFRVLRAHRFLFLLSAGLFFAIGWVWLNLSGPHPESCTESYQGRDKMDFSTRFEGLEKRTSEALASVKSAAAESRDQLRERIDQAQVDLDLAGKEAKQKVGEAEERAQSKWAQMKADAAAKMDDVKARIDKRNTQLDAKMAADEADWAEADALDAIDYAQWTIENARLLALDALDARAYADERAKAAGNAP
jgi:hypothetical protein